MKTLDLILDESTVSGWDGQHLWLTIVIMVMALAVIIFTGAQYGKDIHVVLIVLDILVCFGAIVCMCIASLLSVWIIHTPEEKQTEPSNAIQEWAQDKYVLDLTEKQADALYDYRQISDGEPVVEPSSEILVSYYGENTLVRLIQYDEDWGVFTNGQELQTVEGKNK